MHTANDQGMLTSWFSGLRNRWKGKIDSIHLDNMVKRLEDHGRLMTKTEDALAAEMSLREKLHQSRLKVIEHREKLQEKKSPNLVIAEPEPSATSPPMHNHMSAAQVEVLALNIVVELPRDDRATAWEIKKNSLKSSLSPGMYSMVVRSVEEKLKLL